MESECLSGPISDHRVSKYSCGFRKDSGGGKEAIKCLKWKVFQVVNLKGPVVKVRMARVGN